MPLYLLFLLQLRISYVRSPHTQRKAPDLCRTHWSDPKILSGNSHSTSHWRLCQGSWSIYKEIGKVRFPQSHQHGVQRTGGWTFPSLRPGEQVNKPSSACVPCDVFALEPATPGKWRWNRSGSCLEPGCTCTVWQDTGGWTFPWALCTCRRWPGLNSLEEGLRDEPKKNYVEWKKPHKKEYLQFDAIYMKFQRIYL